MKNMLVICIGRTPDYWKAKGPVRWNTLCKAVCKLYDKTSDESRRKKMFRILLRAMEVDDE